MRTIVFAVVIAAFAACGDAGPDNISSCQKFVNAAKCGAVDLSETYNCSTYDVSTCDLSPYFDCLAMHYICMNGMYETAESSTAGTCNALASCQ